MGRPYGEVSLPGPNKAAVFVNQELVAVFRHWFLGILHGCFHKFGSIS